jgi:hypothetical protein
MYTKAETLPLPISFRVNRVKTPKYPRHFNISNAATLKIPAISTKPSHTPHKGPPFQHFSAPTSSRAPKPARFHP